MGSTNDIPFDCWNSHHIFSKRRSICYNWIDRKSSVESTDWLSYSNWAEWGWYSLLNSMINDRNTPSIDSSISLRCSWDVDIASDRGILMGANGNVAKNIIRKYRWRPNQLMVQTHMFRVTCDASKVEMLSYRRGHLRCPLYENQDRNRFLSRFLWRSS